MDVATPGLTVRRLMRFHGEGTLKAYCDLAIADTFVIKGVRVVEGKRGLFVSMPRQQGKDAKWYDSVTVLTREAKDAVDRLVLEAYHEDRAVPHAR